VLNAAFRLKWLWISRASLDKPWLCSLDYGSNTCRLLFDASVSVVLGNGHSCLFWSDKWIGGLRAKDFAPDLLEFVDPKIRASRTVAQGLVLDSWVHDIKGGLSVAAVAQFILLWRQVHPINLDSETVDVFEWKWTVDKSFSVKSAYLAFFEGKPDWPLADSIWKCKAPLKYKLFAWKVAWNRCWTGDRRMRHGLTNDNKCPVCLQEVETISHLLINCVFARAIWFQILSSIGRPQLTPSNSDGLEAWWLAATRGWTRMKTPRVRSLLLLVMRSIWLERNNRVFNNKFKHEALILDELVQEANRWKIVRFL
jgi:hypothetical protein